MHKNTDPYASQARQNRNYMTIGLSLLAVAAVFALLGAGVLGLGRPAGASVTRAGAGAAAVTPKAAPQTTAVTASGLENIPVTVDEQVVKGLPPHILDWLKHLERCERRKVELAGQEMSSVGILSAFSKIGNIRPGDFLDPEAALDKTPGEEERKKTESFEQQWEELIAFFDSKPAPNECLAARNAYDQHISEVKSYLGQIREVFASLGTDSENIELMQQKLDECRKILETNSSAIDVAGKETDRQVQQICDRYEVRKWFSVNADVGGGLSGVLGGLGGMIGR